MTERAYVVATVPLEQFGKSSPYLCVEINRRRGFELRRLFDPDAKAREFKRSGRAYFWPTWRREPLRRMR